MSDNEIKEGQIWSYKNRKDEDESKITVLKVEKLEGSVSVIHIKVDGLKLKRMDSTNKQLTSIEHLPISLETFKKSVVHLETTIKTSINDGYRYWKKMYLEGKAGIWSIEISEVVEMTDGLSNN